MIPLLTWSSYYPDRPLPEKPFEYFKDFSLDDLVQILLWVKNHLESPNRYAELVESLTNRMEESKKEYLRKLLMQCRISQPLVIDKMLVELFRFHTTKSSDRNLDEFGFEDAFLDLLLYFNDLQYEKNIKSLNPSTLESIWAMSLTQISTGFDNINYARTAQIKHLIFLSFLRRYFGENHQTIEKSFASKTGLSSFHEMAFTLSRFYLTTETGEARKLLLPNMPAEFCKVLEQLSLVVDYEDLPDPSFTIGKLAGLPYYKSYDKVHVINRNNFAFALEKSWPYFLHQNSNLKDYIPGKGRFSDFQAILGKNYVEDYFLNTILSSLSKTGFRWLRPTETYMPDGCYIINESSIILFEFKSSSLHFNIIAEQNLEGLKTFFKDNFASGKKGASQLLNAIKHISTSAKSVYGINAPIHKITIYPVIIYTDMNLTMMGLTTYVDNHFQKILGDVGTKFKQIMPLTMVHADFFTENLTLLTKDRSLLKDALDHYLRYRRKKGNVFTKTQSAADFITGQYQFDRYIQGYKKLYFVPQIDIFRHLAKLFDLNAQ